jgi:hypothetical protein
MEGGAMRISQVATARIHGYSLREYADTLLSMILGWDGEERSELGDDEELVITVLEAVELAYSAGFMAGEKQLRLVTPSPADQRSEPTTDNQPAPLVVETE